MTVLTWVAWGAGGLVALYIIATVYLSVVLAWQDRRTVGHAYYGLPAAGRAQFRDALRGHARRLAPFLRFLGRTNRVTFAKASFRQDGLAGPRGTCSPETFAAARAYEPRPADVFVATQMKCGTTWMQQVVYEIVHRGNGSLVDRGATLYGECPWLEGRKSIPVDVARSVGTARPSRIIKTHMPASHCPFSSTAKYIYVARHPVSCFASCADFIRTNLGTFAPGLDDTEAWFRSDEWMWWGPWPAHVAGWWDLSVAHENVFFVHFEEMKRDLASVVRDIVAFLGIDPFTEAEVANVTRKSGFAYMQEHQDSFEMHPPHVLAADATLFVRGTSDRHRDVSLDVRSRISAWARESLAGHRYPLDRFYPDEGSATRAD